MHVSVGGPKFFLKKQKRRYCFGNLHRCWLHALTGVPRVVTVWPGQLRLEAVDQVEERPGQDDDVVNTAVQDHHLAGVSEACVRWDDT